MPFDILMLQVAVLKPNWPEEGTAVLHQGEDDLELRRAFASSSRGKRREATKFCDELQILANVVHVFR